LVGAVEDHALGGEAVEIGGVEGGGGVVGFEVEGRLVIDEDEKEVGARWG
jgi:hypothetical protein